MAATATTITAGVPESNKVITKYLIKCTAQITTEVFQFYRQNPVDTKENVANLLTPGKQKTTGMKTAVQPSVRKRHLINCSTFINGA